MDIWSQEITCIKVGYWKRWKFYILRWDTGVKDYVKMEQRRISSEVLWECPGIGGFSPYQMIYPLSAAGNQIGAAGVLKIQTGFWQSQQDGSLVVLSQVTG